MTNASKKYFIPAGLFFIVYVLTNIVRLIVLSSEVHATIRISWDFVLFLGSILVLGGSLFTRKFSRFTLLLSAIISFSLIFDTFSGILNFFGYPRIYLLISVFGDLLELAAFLFLTLFLDSCHKNETVRALWFAPGVLTAAYAFVSIFSLLISGSQSIGNLLLFISGVLFLSCAMLFLSLPLKAMAYGENLE